MNPLTYSAKVLGAAVSLSILAACSTAATPDSVARAQTAPVPRAERPNILFIRVDGLRPDLGIYGHPVAQTPHLDALGRSGMVFDNAITQQALCAPSRAALMTGVRPSTSGIHNIDVPVDKAMPGIVTMLDTRNVRSAIKDLRALGQSGEPFLMAVGLHRPHLPYIAPKEDWDRYDPATIPDPVNPNGQEGAPPWAVVMWDLWNYEDNKPYEAAKKLPEAKADELRHAYLASVSYADSLVDELTAALKETGLDKNTIVVLWSDHGYKLGDQGGWSKHSNVNLDIRIPFMISAPGLIAPGSRTSAMVETVDVYPTLAELAGLTPPDTVEGFSMVPQLTNPGRAWKSAAFAEYPRWPAGQGRTMGYTVRSQEFRYTVWVPDRDGSILAQELYHLRIDPTESRNVAGDPKYSAGLARLEQMRRDGWRSALPKSR